MLYITMGGVSLHNLECSFLNGSVCELTSLEKSDAVRELIAKVSVFHTVADTEKLAREVLVREQKQSTGFGHGVAVAHAQYTGIDTVIMALGISRRGIEFEALDGDPVHLLFLIASPPLLQDVYLQALSVLVKLVRQRDFRRALLQASDAAEIETILHHHFCSLLKKERKHAV